MLHCATVDYAKPSEGSFFCNIFGWSLATKQNRVFQSFRRWLCLTLTSQRILSARELLQKITKHWQRWGYLGMFFLIWQRWTRINLQLPACVFLEVSQRTMEDSIHKQFYSAVSKVFNYESSKKCRWHEGTPKAMIRRCLKNDYP